MFTVFDKALTGFILPVAVFMAEKIISGGAPLEVLTDVNMWVTAVATAIGVYAVPNKGTRYVR